MKILPIHIVKLSRSYCTSKCRNIPSISLISSGISSPTLIRLQFWQFNVLPYVSWIGTAGFRRRIVKMLPWKDLHHVQDMIDYMYGVSEEIYKMKINALNAGDEAVALQIGRGNDLISVLSETLYFSDMCGIISEFFQ